MDLQFKTFPFEVKAAGADGSTFEGLVSAFLNVDSQGDIVDPSAFDQDLERFMADGFIGGLNHDWDNPIGRPQPGTKVVSDGLFLRANVIDTTHGLDVRKMLSAGVVRKLSIGFQLLGRTIMETLDDVMAYWDSKAYTPSATDMSRAAQGYVRLLTRIHLYEGSPVTVPANDLATITAVKAAQARALFTGVDLAADDRYAQEEAERAAARAAAPPAIPADVRGIESLLRDAGGFSQTAAKAIISQIKAIQIPLQRDAESEPEPTPPEEPEQAASEPETADVTPAPEAAAEETAEEPKAADEPSLVVAPVYAPVYSPETLALQQRIALQQFQRFQSQIGAK